MKQGKRFELALKEEPIDVLDRDDRFYVLENINKESPKNK